MPLSYIQIHTDGSQNIFPFDFKYLHKDHLKVTVDGQPQAYRFHTKSSIEFEQQPSKGSVVEIRRVTPCNDPLVYYTAGPIISNDLNKANLQSLYLHQEYQDSQETRLSFCWDGCLDGKNIRIKNVEDGVLPSDVATVGQAAASIKASQEALKAQEKAEEFYKKTEALARDVEQCIGGVYISSTDKTLKPLSDKFRVGVGLTSYISKKNGEEVFHIDTDDALDASSNLYLSYTFL